MLQASIMVSTSYDVHGMDKVFAQVRDVLQEDDLMAKGDVVP